jgi:branched-chain amino acid aminotransferase
MPTDERRISIDEVVNAITSGKLTEAFGTGTAVGIAPIGNLSYQNNEYQINGNETGPIAHKIYNELMNIQQGKTCDNAWIESIV